METRALQVTHCALLRLEVTAALIIMLAPRARATRRQLPCRPAEVWQAILRALSHFKGDAARKVSLTFRLKCEMDRLSAYSLLR